MELTNEEEAQGYEFEAPLPLVKLLVGDLQHRKVYDVSQGLFLGFKLHLNGCFCFSFGNSTTKNEN